MNEKVISLINWIISHWEITTSIIVAITAVISFLYKWRKKWVANNHAELRANIFPQKPSRIIRIYNPSEAEATNIRVEGLEIDNIAVYPIDLPFPSLKSKARFDIKVSPFNSSPDYLKIKIIWDDKSGKNHEAFEVLQL
ncbi:hypothetical protein M2459_002145 [Parabacteroides sp. PF5-5]|uniref:hypothetical protein n=1 Tax=unclassified Parabacteroides TaxID=2649774 RepID=UPI0024759C9C|nr:MULTISPECIES: hypothetical protein [unclassified Parabacteroides]MDH6306838.1 hypothetical protein [Parabacteroides sp. PH5-39]MDH6316284.1 hypothetical protein [Parabacteroides sp. PF5-13]MDH6319767.1 hypothetical protein [Parabacteroides sp. PH5-13]MDH6323642.1 hypothetical protein [Parabacteroides sp. PH5-8]MDH6327471.1 hypothetical protein [Parabacteroides sp. PH5-41]